jgi:hypothetical protein
MDQNPLNEFYTVKKDAADPSGTGQRGLAPGVDLSKSAVGHPVILYRTKEGKEFFLTADVYAIPGEPMAVHVYCPLCSNHLTIRQDNKAIDYDRHATVKIPGYRTEEILAGLGLPDLGGRLSVEPFRCSWETVPDLRREFGFGVCTWSVVIDNNLARNV